MLVVVLVVVIIVAVTTTTITTTAITIAIHRGPQRFQILPLVLQMSPEQQPSLYTVPRQYYGEVPLVHPKHSRSSCCNTVCARQAAQYVGLSAAVMMPCLTGVSRADTTCMQS